MLSGIGETPFEIMKIIRERVLSSLKSETLVRRVRKVKVTFDETQRTITSRREQARDIDQM